MEQMALRWEPDRKLFSVSELNATIRGLLDQEFADIWVSGEISGTRAATSGHFYFTLKDEQSQLKCVCFRMTARYLRFKPQDGIRVLARGRIDVYEARGEYQLLVDALEPQGFGALQFAFEQLKKKLSAEGLFDPGRRRPLPRLPARIGVVTSPTGAVIQDMLNVLLRRFPGLHIRLFPALVQGEGSVEAVCRGIRYFSEGGWADVMIVARGGGPLEDLWTFNEEDVARAIASSKVPVVSAIGHETDFTIADFVADLRAPTPSAAAELVICTREQLLDQIFGCRKQLQKAIHYRLSVSARRLHEQGVDRASALLHRNIGKRMQRLDELERCVRDHTRSALRDRRKRWADTDARLRRMDLRLRFSDAHRRIDGLRTALSRLITLRLTRSRAQFEPLDAQLREMSPLRILDRGYALVQTAEGMLVKDSSQTPAGTEIRVRLARGRLAATVLSNDGVDGPK
jgi:exodeoxyribonuclease VII large subunit